MLSRRALLTAGMASGLASTANGAPVAGAEQSQSEILKDISRGIESIDRSMDEAWLSNNTAFGLVARVRSQLEIYFKTNQRFPDAMDIGLSVFMETYDWHVKHQQQLMISRGPDARYWIRYMFTTLVLRGEQDANYIGVPYDRV
jgi:hypothetical protein